jgi:hypothetical protein
MTRIRDRSTGDLMVLMIASTVCVLVMGSAITVVVVEIVNPETDTTGALRQISSIISTLIGLLAGFLAGRTDVEIARQRRESSQSGDQ